MGEERLRDVHEDAIERDRVMEGGDGPRVDALC
jgi:hypothetical protein